MALFWLATHAENYHVVLSHAFFGLLYALCCTGFQPALGKMH